MDGLSYSLTMDGAYNCAAAMRDVRLTRELCLPNFEHDPHRPYAWLRAR
jgi:hypothetical protein